MPAEPASGPASPDKLSLVVFSGDFERVHYALVVASSAIATNTPATLFFTMEACRALEKAGAEPAWRALPAAGGRTGGEADDAFALAGVATFEELLSSCVELGVRFMVCEMGLRAMGLDRSALRDDVPFETGGVVSFLNDASPGGAMVFI